MGENVKHFSLEEKNDNTYGWPWNEVVKNISSKPLQRRRKTVLNKNQKQRVQDFKERKRHSIL